MFFVDVKGNDLKCFPFTSSEHKTLVKKAGSSKQKKKYTRKSARIDINKAQGEVSSFNELCEVPIQEDSLVLFGAFSLDS